MVLRGTGSSRGGSEAQTVFEWGAQYLVTPDEIDCGQTEGLMAVEDPGSVWVGSDLAGWVLGRSCWHDVYR